jgi:tryptophan synthase beta chain
MLTQTEKAPGNDYLKPFLETKFGPYGVQFVKETLMPALSELETAYRLVCTSPDFRAELEDLLKTYVGRPTALTFARRLTDHLGSADLYQARGPAHSGAHKINNALFRAAWQATAMAAAL